MNRVFMVEDNDLNLKLFCDLLKIKKCEVMISQDGINVLNDVLKTQPDLILMDIQLKSEISGLDLIKELKQHKLTQHIPIIVITAFAMQAEEELISKSGCDMYLSKPVSIEHFFSAIDVYLNETPKIQS